MKCLKEIDQYERKKKSVWKNGTGESGMEKEKAKKIQTVVQKKKPGKWTELKLKGEVDPCLLLMHQYGVNVNWQLGLTVYF